MGEDHMEKALMDRLTEMSGTDGEAVPLQALLAGPFGLPSPQRLFDSIKHLLEQGRVELVQEEGEAARVAPAAAAPHGRSRPLGAGELAELAVAVAGVRGHRSAQSQQESTAAIRKTRTDMLRAGYRRRIFG